MKINFRKKLPYLFIALTGLSLTACGSNPNRSGGANGGLIDGSGGGANSTATITVDADGEQVDPNSISGRAPQARVIYFDFDTSEIRPEYIDVILQHGRYLAQNSSGRVRLEGHTDERGTREYNIALGEGRAQSIARMLQLQGVSSAQLRTVSYGEELPVDENHSADAWAQNRRVQIIYENTTVPN